MKDKTLVIGTGNPNKLTEIRELVAAIDLRVEAAVVGIAEIAPGLEHPEETGSTFAENAGIKALYYANATGHIAIADDSGLEVDALDGAPGLFSARYAGENSDDDANNAKLLDELARLGPEDRSARFRCAIAVAAPGQILLTVDESCEGVILEEARGEGGFGYDPLFYFPALGKTFAEIPRAEKARVSHRGKALARLAEGLASAIAIVDNVQND